MVWINKKGIENEHINLWFSKMVKERDSQSEEESFRYLENICLENHGVGDVNEPPIYTSHRSSIYLVKRMVIQNTYKLSMWPHEPAYFYTTILSHKHDLDKDIVEKFREFYGKEWKRESI
jgi:hypothetical protein